MKNEDVHPDTRRLDWLCCFADEGDWAYLMDRIPMDDPEGFREAIDRLASLDASGQEATTKRPSENAPEPDRK